MKASEPVHGIGNDVAEHEPRVGPEEPEAARQLLGRAVEPKGDPAESLEEAVKNSFVDRVPGLAERLKPRRGPGPLDHHAGR
jgi:hypothetical protein